MIYDIPRRGHKNCQHRIHHCFGLYSYVTNCASEKKKRKKERYAWHTARKPAILYTAVRALSRLAALGGPFFFLFFPETVLRTASTAVRALCIIPGMYVSTGLFKEPATVQASCLLYHTISRGISLKQIGVVLPSALEGRRSPRVCLLF